MSDFRDIEVRASNQSLIISVVIGLLSLLILLISFTFEDTYPKFQPIEIAMNFGNSEVGQGDEEPMPAETQETAASSAPAAVEQPQTVTPTTPMENVVTQNTTETRPAITKTPTPKPQPQKTTTPSTKSDQYPSFSLFMRTLSSVWKGINGVAINTCFANGAHTLNSAPFRRKVTPRPFFT